MLSTHGCTTCATPYFNLSVDALGTYPATELSASSTYLTWYIIDCRDTGYSAIRC